MRNAITKLKQGKLKVSILDKGTAWLDTGTFNSLMQASQFVEVIEERQGLKVGAIEAIAYEMGYINKEQLKKLLDSLPLLIKNGAKNIKEDKEHEKIQILFHLNLEKMK